MNIGCLRTDTSLIIMGNCKNLEHAEHNEKVCNYLSKKPTYSDWTITTAFYSALHYVRHKMLPQVVGTGKDAVKYEDFESLYHGESGNTEGRHGFQLNWVKREFSEIDFEYARLHELSRNARYLNYNHGREVAIEVKNHLKSIKEFCLN